MTCCFCEEPIQDGRVGAVSLAIVGMGENPPGQQLSAHTSCLAERFAPIGATAIKIGARFPLFKSIVNIALIVTVN